MIAIPRFVASCSWTVENEALAMTLEEPCTDASVGPAKLCKDVETKSLFSLLTNMSPRDDAEKLGAGDGSNEDPFQVYQFPLASS